MGKIRVKVIGEEDSPKKKKSYEERKALQRVQDETEKKTSAEESGGKQDEAVDVKAEAPVTEEVAAVEEENDTSEKIDSKTKEEAPVKKAEVKTPTETQGAKKLNKKTYSKKYTSNFSAVDKNKSYKLTEAVKMLKEFKASKFDETVELHLNVKEEGISGTLSLPHGTGKQVRVKIADEALIEQIEKGKIDFDVLIASPSLMPKLAKVARVLGPKGLMPNPKNGTVTDDPKPLMEKLSQGQIRFKTEAKAPVIHLSVGKVSFDADKLSENITTVLTSVGQAKITKVTLKSTMSPGIKVSL